MSMPRTALKALVEVEVGEEQMEVLLLVGVGVVQQAALEEPAPVEQVAFVVQVTVLQMQMQALMTSSCQMKLGVWMSSSPPLAARALSHIRRAADPDSHLAAARS